MTRRLLLTGSPAQRGREHGSPFPDEIQAYTEDRIVLVMQGSWSGGRNLSRTEVLGLADSLIRPHAEYAPDLFREMESMADAAGISVPEAIIVGGFTDFIDVVRGTFDAAPEDDTCTAMMVPAAATATGHALYAQTWDMHDSATQHVVLLEIEDMEHPRAFVLTTLGCAGQLGMNEAGITVGINNLTAAQGQIGVTWPFVVRKALQQTTVDHAVKTITESPVAGAHNYMVMGANGTGVNIEVMPQAFHVTEVVDRPYVHTNHCLYGETEAFQASKAPQLMESSQSRKQRAETMLREGPIDAERLMGITRDSQAVCQISRPPYHIESCGAAVMSPATGDFWAVAGRPDQNQYEHFSFA